MPMGHNLNRRRFLQASVGSGAAALALGRYGYRGFAAETAGAGLTVERFHELHKELAPDESEPMQTIPWKVYMNEARKLAAERKQPVFMLSRSGHPLGCT